MARRPAPSPTSRHTPLIVAALLAVLVLFVFAQVRRHDFLNYDDPIYVTANPVVQRGLTADGIGWAFRSLDFNWHPVTWISHMLDVELFGLDPGRHHLMSVFIHLASVVLLFFVLHRMTGFLARSAFVAALFAIHPLHVESVAWLSERKDVLSALFLMLTLWMYADYARTRSKAKYVLALLFFILGLMSKGMLVTLPFVLLLLDYWPLKRFDAEPRTRLIVEKIPFFALIVPSIAMTVIAQRAVGAVATSHPLPTRLANAITSYGAYLWKSVWPAGLAIPYPWRTSISPLAVGIAAIALLAITAYVFVNREKNRALFTGWFWFVGMLVPVIGLIQIGSQSMADRYTYLPHIGLFIAVVWVIADAVPLDTRQVLATVGVVVIALFAFIAARQTTHWRDSIALFTRATTVTERNSIAHMNLGTALQDAGNGDGAFEQLQKSVEADPTSSDALVKLARVEMQLGRNDEAAAHLQKAQPTAETLALLATVRNDHATAIAQYEKAVAADPTSAGLRNDYAAALARAERNDEALAQYREAMRLAPNLYDPRMNIGALLTRLNRIPEAREAFTAAAAIRPGSPEPYVYLALLNANSGRIDLALMSVESAAAIDPVQANLYFTNAVRMPFKSTNLQEFAEMLRAQQSQPPPPR
jgi:protein O-mannosyl-transferase